MRPTRYLKGECGHCGGHIEFPAESAGLTADCPHCGLQTDLLLIAPKQEPTIPRSVIIWTAAAVLILVLGLGGALAALTRARNWAERQQQAKAQSATQTQTQPQGTPPSQESTPVVEASTTNAITKSVTPSATPEPPIRPDFRVSAIKLEKTPGTKLIYAVGTVVNTASKQRFGVKVELDLLDAAGVRLGVAKDYQSVIEPKGSWQFKALVVESGAVAARLTSLKEDQ